MRVIGTLLLAVLIGAVFLVGLYFLSPEYFVKIVVAGERASAGLERHETDVDGFHIAYLDSKGTGEPLLLVHGFASDKDSWNRVARTLSKHFRIIAVDMPGFGESSAKPGATYTIPEQTERLHAFVGSIGLTRVHIGGFSMGGFIAADYAIRYPNEVGSVWLIDSAGVWTAPQSELQKRLETNQGNPLLMSSVDDFREMAKFMMSKPPYFPDRALAVLAQREIDAQALRVQQFKDVNSSPKLEGRIDGLPIPLHIVWGKKDRALDVGAVDILKKLVPGATATVMPGIGHVPILEDPDGTAADYLRFRQGVEATMPVTRTDPPA